MIVSKDALTPPPPGDGTPPDNGPAGRDSVAPRTPPLPVGSRVEGYTLLDVVGATAHSTVYKAGREGRTLALKVFHRGHRPPGPETESRRPGANHDPVRHPSLAPVEDAGESEGTFFCARPYLRGDSLRAILESHESGASPLPALSPLAPTADGSPRPDFARCAVTLFAEVAEGLEQLHARGILHGRIHPGNLILASSGRLVLTDFDDAADAEEGDDSGALPRRATVAVGELEEDALLYLAPELLRARRGGDAGLPVDARTEVYALAAVLYHLLLRREPPLLGARVEQGVGEGTPSGEEDPACCPEGLEGDELGSDLRSVLGKALASDPGDRYPCAAELAADLRRLLELQRPGSGGDRLEPRPGLREESAWREELRTAGGRPANYRASSLLAGDRSESGDPVENSGPDGDVGGGGAGSVSESGRVSPPPGDAGAVRARGPERQEKLSTRHPGPGPGGMAPEAGDAPGELPARGRSGPSLAPLPVPQRPVAPANARSASPCPPGRFEAHARPPVLPEPGPIEEREALFAGSEAEIAPLRSGVWGTRELVVVVCAFLLLLATFVVIALGLHDRSEHYKLRSLHLERGARHLQEAVLGLAQENAPGAAGALASASAELESSDRPPDAPVRSQLDDLARRLGALPSDGLLARLRDRRSFVRSSAIEELGRQVVAGERPEDDLRAVASCLRDEAPVVASAAVETCARAGLFDAILDAYPLGADSPTITLEFSLFAELYRALGRAAIGGHPGATAAFRSVSLEDLDRLDRALAHGNVPVRGAVAANTTVATFRLEMAPNLRVRMIASGSHPELVAVWLDVTARTDPDELIRRLPLLERRADIAPRLADALARTGGPSSVAALRRLVVTRYLDAGRPGIEALARLGEGAALVALADEPIPLELRRLAVSRATTLGTDESQEAIAGLLRRHPEPRLRLAALEALSAEGFLERHPGSLDIALGDPFLRARALDLLGPELPGVAVDHLLAVLESSPTDLRARVIRLLGQSGKDDVLLPLVRQLRETDPGIREATLDALVALGDLRALPLVAGTLPPGYPGVRSFALAILEAGEPPGDEGADLLVLAIQEALEFASPGAESYGLKRLRRWLLLRRSGVDLRLFDLAVPPSLRYFLAQR